MANTDELINQIRQLLAGLLVKREEDLVVSIFKHPLVVTVVGSILVVIGTNWVTKSFQLRDDKSKSLMYFTQEVPKEIARSGHMARILSVIEDEQCNLRPGETLSNPAVLGLSGKTCVEAEAMYLEYFEKYMAETSGDSLARMRALFDSEGVDIGAKKLSVLLSIMLTSKEPTCIDALYEKANMIFEQTVEFSVNEIEGKTPNLNFEGLRISETVSSCRETPFCEIAVARNDPEVKLLCD